jgi:hypothetical protein
VHALISLQGLCQHPLALAHQLFLPGRETLVQILEEVGKTLRQIAFYIEAARRSIPMEPTSRTGKHIRDGIRDGHSFTSELRPALGWSLPQSRSSTACHPQVEILVQLLLSVKRNLSITLIKLIYHALYL